MYPETPLVTTKVSYSKQFCNNLSLTFFIGSKLLSRVIILLKDAGYKGYGKYCRALIPHFVGLVNYFYIL